MVTYSDGRRQVRRFDLGNFLCHQSELSRVRPDRPGAGLLPPGAFLGTVCVCGAPGLEPGVPVPHAPVGDRHEHWTVESGCGLCPLQPVDVSGAPSPSQQSPTLPCSAHLHCSSASSQLLSFLCPSGLSAPYFSALDASSCCRGVSLGPRWGHGLCSAGLRAPSLCGGPEGLAENPLGT